jgi:hypothetical protein
LRSIASDWSLRYARSAHADPFVRVLSSLQVICDKRFDSIKMSRNQWLVLLLMVVRAEAAYIDPWSCNDLCFKAKDGICDVSVSNVHKFSIGLTNDEGYEGWC